MTASLTLRLRTPSGVKSLTIPPDTPLTSLRDQVASAADLAPATLVIRAGFPPKPLDLTTDATAASALASGEVLTVGGDPPSAAAPAPPSATPAAPAPASPPASAPAAPSADTDYDSITASGSVVERVVPDDNSCLFRSVAGIVHNDWHAAPGPLRRLCADAVAADPDFYTADVLQRGNAEYCAWIMRETAWGGQIELAVLSAHFGVELAAWDLRSMVVHRYGEGKYGTVGFLCFDGLHYNFIALEISGIPDVTKFPSDDVVAFRKAEAVAKARHDNSDFTDVNSFKLKCGQCGTVVRGERAAQDHGNATGHTRFEEV